MVFVTTTLFRSDHCFLFSLPYLKYYTAGFLRIFQKTASAMIRFTISNACSATVLSLEVCVYAKLCYGSLPTGDPVHRQRIQEGQDMDEEVEAEQTFLSDPTRNGRLVQHG